MVVVMILEKFVMLLECVFVCSGPTKDYVMFHCFLVLFPGIIESTR